MAVVIPFPGAAARHVAQQRLEQRFLLRTAQLVREITADHPQRVDLWHLHTVVDLRRPRLQRILENLTDVPYHWQEVLAAVSDRRAASSREHVSAAQRLAAVLEDAAGGES